MLHKPQVKECIERAWRVQGYREGPNASKKIRRCRKELSKWKKINNSNALDCINHLQRDLETEQFSGSPSTAQINRLKQDLCLAYREE